MSTEPVTKGSISKSHALPSSQNGTAAKTKSFDLGGASVAGAKASTDRALLIGINDYQGTANDLPSCIHDARMMESLLRSDYGFLDTKILVDAEATIANVTGAIEALLRDATPDTRLVFYYSGHGAYERRGSAVEECLVLYDGMLFDDVLSQLSQTVPPGCLTVIMDSCFSGGMEKQLYEAVKSERFGAEAAKLKYYINLDAPSAKAAINTESADLPIKRFGGRIAGNPYARSTTVFGAPVKGMIAAPVSDEVGQRQLNGLLLSACLETETAAASTSLTKGLSAFTYALLEVVGTSGPGLSCETIMERVQAKLRAERFKQTPLLKAPARPAGLGARSFVHLDAVEPKTLVGPGIAQPMPGWAGWPQVPGWSGQPTWPAAGWSQPSFQKGDAMLQEKFWGELARIGISLAPRIISHLMKDGASKSASPLAQMPAEHQEKFLGALVAIASVVVPEVIRYVSKDGTVTVQSKSFGPPSLEAMDKGFWSRLAEIAADVAPHVLESIARTKSVDVQTDVAFAMGKGFWTRALRAVISAVPVVVEALSKATAVEPASYDSGDDKWGGALPRLPHFNWGVPALVAPNGLSTH